LVKRRFEAKSFWVFSIYKVNRIYHLSNNKIKMKKYNFNAGPSILPREVIEQTAQACLDFNGSGLSLMEISHRAKDFQPVVDEAVALFKELLNIPEGYSVLFLGGGASLEFCMVPYNFLEKKAAYLNTGVWATKAEKEAKAFGEVVEVASSADKNFTYIPRNFEIPADADYLHITTNNTIYGTELREDLDSPIPVIADMSSDIFSRPIDVSKYTMIYGGAQKNLAMAGLTFVIVKDDALGKVSRHIPTMLDYRTHVKKGSMFNTPPVVPIYSALMNLRYMKAHGGVEAMQKLAEQRAEILYAEIDRNKLFVGTAEKDSRSLMNITFVLKPEYQDLQDEFLKFATSQGMVGVKGHRDVGGFRASCYNAMSVEGVQALVKCMQEFEAQH
jgi:phosphoserine aminotransferase